jgi:hypothetical protein
VVGVIGRWLSAWRGVKIDMHSPLPVDVVRTRLEAGGTPRWSPSSALSPRFDRRRVISRVRADDSVRLEAAIPMIRNSWRPVAHGVLRPEGTGCRLTATLRAPWFVLLFSGIWLSAAGAFAIVGVLATVVTLVTGHASEAGGPAAVAGGGIGFVVFGAALMGAGFAMGRRDGEFLLGWLAERLNATPTGSPDD